MTGADDNTSVKEMAKLSEKYPFAEWGILFSQAKAGVPRYPSLDWIESLFDHPQQYCAHLCGKWVSDAMKLGVVTFINDDDMLDLFGRFQLNMGKDRLKSALDPDKGELLWQGLSNDVAFILGGDYSVISEWNTVSTMDLRTFILSGVLPLFDASGGHGDVPQEWPSPLVVERHPLLCGYAGGLNPENLKENLLLIERACWPDAQAEIWIDAESGLRNDKDEFDLEKCAQFLEIAKSWTG